VFLNKTYFLIMQYVLHKIALTGLT